MEKTDDLLWQLFGLDLSRAATLGHLRWGAALFDPVVKKLFEILRESPVIHADETGWRIDGKTVWCLVHLLLRDLHALRDELSRHHVTKYVGPLITLLQDAIELSKQRDRGAAAFATWKSVIGTCRKNGLNFLEYGLSVLRARAAASPLPLDSG